MLPLALALQQHPELWDQNNVRKTFDNSPHRAVSDIWLRFNQRIGKNVGNELQMVNYPAWNSLTAARPIIFDLLRRIEANQLGRVMITRLGPGKRILAHSDVLGKYAHFYNRYHVVVRGLPGNIFRAGGDEVFMPTGSVWWFNAHEEHEVINNSEDDRIHLIIDARTN